MTESTHRCTGRLHCCQGPSFSLSRSLLSLFSVALCARLSGSTFCLTQYVPDLCARQVMGVISEQVATEIIKYPEVLREFAVSVVSCSFLPRQCSLPRARETKPQTAQCLQRSFKFLAGVNICISVHIYHLTLVSTGSWRKISMENFNLLNTTTTKINTF